MNGFFVASPEDGNLSTLVVNDLELSFGSGGWLTSRGGGLNIQTLWGSIGTWFQDRVIQVKRGFGLRLTYDEIKREIYKEPYRDYKYESLQRAMEILRETEKEPADPPSDPEIDYKLKSLDNAMALYFGCEDWRTNPGCGKEDDAATEKRYGALEELRRKQKQWKGGWWKMTYGPTTRNGLCGGVVVADGLGGGSGEPYTTEVPICRGNNGNTILMYESGASYDLVAPNLYARSFVTEFDLLGNGDLTREGKFMTLQIVSPTRIILSNAGTENDSCTTASVAYLDYLRDDPNVRCGLIIDIDYYETPEPPTPTPAPQNVEPPIQDPYQVRFGTLMKACDPAAQPYAPSFTTAGLSLSLENRLVIDAPSTRYEMEMSNLIYPYSSDELEEEQNRLGIFTLQQPLDSAFNLTMSLVQMPDQLYTGNWLVANEAGSQLCGGSIDLLPPE